MRRKTIKNSVTLIVLLGFLVSAIKERSLILATIFLIGIIIYIGVKFGGGRRGN